MRNPNRRDLKSLNAQAKGLVCGETLAVVFRDKRHGTFRVDGSLSESRGGTELVLGGWTVRNAKRKVRKKVRAFDLSELPAGEQVDATKVVHGEFVSVWFSQHPYGRFGITGYATESDFDNFVLVGGWIVAQNGVAAARVQRVLRIASPSPPRRAREEFEVPPELSEPQED